MSYRDPAAIKQALASRTWAVVGLTSHDYRAAHTVAAFLQANGIRIVPVNPLAEAVRGENGYAHLSDIAFPIDVVDIFRRFGSGSAARTTRQSVSARGASGCSSAWSMSRQPGARWMPASLWSWTHARKSSGRATARVAADSAPTFGLPPAVRPVLGFSRWVELARCWTAPSGLEVILSEDGAVTPLEQFRIDVPDADLETYAGGFRSAVAQQGNRLGLVSRITAQRAAGAL